MVRAAGAIQAQDARAGALGIRARLAGATESAVRRALVEERSIVRAWTMRGTLHYVPAEDLRWMIALLGPLGLARNRKRLEQLGARDEAAQAAVRAALAEHGALTRHEVAAEARARGARLADDPQTATHLVATAVLEGHAVEAAPRGRESKFALVDDWLGPAGPLPDRDAALAELARRHAAAHPPAGPEDLAAWSGLPIGDARRAFAAVAGELDEVRVLGRAAWVPRGLEPAPREVRLLPAWDNLLLGHRDRALTVRPEHAVPVVPGGGILRPSLVVGGRVEGTWRLERGRPDVTPFAPLPRRAESALASEAEDVIRFRAG